MPESHELSTHQCEALLRVGMVGRVAFSTPTGPHMVPVNYTVVDDAVVVRTSPYSLLGTHGRNTTVAFGVDGFDHELERGWSVQARGRMEVVTAHQELERIREVADPSPFLARLDQGAPVGPHVVVNAERAAADVVEEIVALLSANPT